MYGAGQMRFAPALAIPVWVRSHFDAQDVLANDGEGLRAQVRRLADRALVAAGGQGGLKGPSIGAQTPLILHDAAKTSSWASGGRVTGGDRAASLLPDLYVDNPMLGHSLARGLQTEALS